MLFDGETNLPRIIVECRVDLTVELGTEVLGCDGQKSFVVGDVENATDLFGNAYEPARKAFFHHADQALIKELSQLIDNSVNIKVVIDDCCGNVGNRRIRKRGHRAPRAQVDAAGSSDFVFNALFRMCTIFSSELCKLLNAAYRAFPTVLLPLPFSPAITVIPSMVMSAWRIFPTFSIVMFMVVPPFFICLQAVLSHSLEMISHFGGVRRYRGIHFPIASFAGRL